MDVVLEIFDTFLFDRLYAAALPASTLAFGHHAAKDATTTFSSMRELPTAIARSNQLFQLEPSQYAYMSQWGRHNIWRQGISLYLITWYDHLCNSLGSAIDLSIGCLELSSTSSSPPCPMSSSSTMQPSPIPGTSRTKSVSRSDRPSYPFPSWPSSQPLYSSAKSAATASSMIHPRTPLSGFTTSSNFPSFYALRISASIGSIVACTTH